METLLNKVFYTVVILSIETVVEFIELYERIRDRHVKAWKNLTRPLRPTDVEAAREAASAQQRAVIVNLNQDTKQYNSKSWWKEYRQARKLHVN